MQSANPRDTKLKVLIIAEAANPEWTSVPLIGWSLSFAIAQEFDAHLVTQIRNKEAIERTGWTEGNEFTAIDSELFSAPLYKMATSIRRGKQLAWTVATAAGSVSYPYFEYLCWRQFKTRLAAGEFDLVHRVTPVSPTAPSYLAKKLKKLGVPFIVGPINGGVAWPKQYMDRMKKEGEWLSKIRWLYKVLPGYRSLRRDASALISGSYATQSELPNSTRGKQFYIPENAIDTQRFPYDGRKTFHKPLRAIFIGRLVPYKGVDIAIDAMIDFLKSGELTFEIYGDGPEKAQIEQQIRDNNVHDSVNLVGFIDHKSLQESIQNAHILVFPSIREFGGGVILEAMALGIVPIVADYAGPGELVKGRYGYKVPLDDRAGLVAGFRETIATILQEPDILIEKSKAARAEVEAKFTWPKKVEQLEQVYRWVLDGGEKPTLFDP